MSYSIEYERERAKHAHNQNEREPWEYLIPDEITEEFDVVRWSASLDESMRAKVTEVFNAIPDNARLHLQRESPAVLKKIFGFFSRTVDSEDFRYPDGYFDFKEIVQFSAGEQIALLTGLARLSEKAINDIVTYGRGELWPLICFGYSRYATNRWADKLTPEMASALYKRLSIHSWSSRSLLDVLALLTESDALMQRYKLWTEYQIMYDTVNSNLAFKLAVRDYVDAEKLSDYRSIVRAALGSDDVMDEFESRFDINSSADDALKWCLQKLQTHPANPGIARPWSSWQHDCSVARKYGVELIWPYQKRHEEKKQVDLLSEDI